MMKKQFDNENFVLYSPDSLNYITYDLENILNESLELYKKIFDIDNFRKVEIHYYDNLQEFRNYVYKLRGEKESLPSYAQGVFDNGMIISYINPKIIDGTPLYIHKKYLASHELFHIMYQELVWKRNNQKRIVWFDEGMAQFFSKENDRELNINFNNWFNLIKTNTRIIPNLNELEHGVNFQTNEYNGYDLSLLAVKYLYDKLGFDEFKKLINNNNQIIEYGNSIIQESFEYYEKKMRLK